MTATRHPAKYSGSVIDAIGEWVSESDPVVVLDPFAGVGTITRLFEGGVGVELEPEWASQGERGRMIVGDATRLPIRTASIDVVVTSPTYGNRMADHHDARDASRRNTYRHALGRPLHERNTGMMQWGDNYRRMHREAWSEARRVLRPRGLLIVNVSNHVRRGVEEHVVEWHLAELFALGLRLRGVRYVITPRLRYGANRDKRAAHEFVICVAKESPMG